VLWLAWNRPGILAMLLYFTMRSISDPCTITDESGQSRYEVTTVPDIAERLALRQAGGGPALVTVVRDPGSARADPCQDAGLPGLSPEFGLSLSIRGPVVRRDCRGGTDRCPTDGRRALHV